MCMEKIALRITIYCRSPLLDGDFYTIKSKKITYNQVLGLLLSNAKAYGTAQVQSL